jgi:hypothetical protein
MFELMQDDSDAPEFMERIGRILFGLCSTERPSQFYVTKIKNWFGPKWLSFSGKALGAVDVWQPKLTLPPFVPSRVLNQELYDLVLGKYVLSNKQPQLHVRQKSSDNFGRRIELLASHALLVWFSSDSAKLGKGALMAYLTTGKEPWPWYVGFSKIHEWKISRLRGISLKEIELFSNQQSV